MTTTRRTMTLNMGPQHPSTHGVLRLVLELDGEIVVGVTPVVGYLHRAIGKIAEGLRYEQFVPTPTVSTTWPPPSTTWGTSRGWRS